MSCSPASHATHSCGRERVCHLLKRYMHVELCKSSVTPYLTCSLWVQPRYQVVAGKWYINPGSKQLQLKAG